MPIYEYMCKKWGEISEFIKIINTKDKTEVCPLCGGKATRIVSQSSFILKGSGWYVTDYKGTKKNTASQNKQKVANNNKTADKPATEAKETSKAEKAS
jgi:putative FmdB family regulatory protein